MKTSNDYYKAFNSLVGEIKSDIQDILENQYKMTTLEIDEDIRNWHPFGYASELNGWMEQGLAKVETAPDGEVILSNEYGEVLFEEFIPQSEWAVILQAIERQLEKNAQPTIEQLIERINLRIHEDANLNDYSTIEEVDNDKHWADLVFIYGIEEITNAVAFAQKYNQFSFADLYFYFDCEGRYIKSFNTIEDIKNHFEPKN